MIFIIFYILFKKFDIIKNYCNKKIRFEMKFSFANNEIYKIEKLYKNILYLDRKKDKL